MTITYIVHDRSGVTGNDVQITVDASHTDYAWLFARMHSYTNGFTAALPLYVPETHITIVEAAQ